MSPVDPSPIPLVARLASALRDAGVLYCHWKSNAAVDHAERGESDLDLLVARYHVREFNRVLSRCGFVAAERQRPPNVPAVTHFFGYDATVDRFVHVHAHYQLVLGHDRTKNYHLPIEEPYLASASVTRVFPTPAPEFEYVVFVIRMVLKYAISDEILWNAARGRRAEPKQSEREEFDHLQRLINTDLVSTILKEHLPYLDATLFEAAVKVVRGDAPTWRRILVARKMQSSLESHTRHAPVVDVLLRMWRRVVLLMRRRSGVRSGYRLASGGAIIAIMGGDGAGKSTALTELGRWLERDFDVRRIHLGKPKWSWTTYAVRGSLKVAKVVGSALPRRAVPTESIDDSGTSFPGYRPLLWFACKARDRYLTYRKARRFANKGGIVISDRFPHPSLRLMDVPQIARLTGGHSRNGLVALLIGLENRYHRLVVLPELVVVLRLDPEEAARRKADEPYDYVLERSAEIWDLDWTGSSVHVIDASQATEAVVAELKDLIWSSLA